MGERMDLTAKVALVTGGGRGIGRIHAIALAAAGARVIVNDLGCAGGGQGSDSAPADTVVEEIRASGGQAESDTRSVAEWDDAHALIDDIIGRHGHLDIIVNNAGLARAAQFGEISQTDVSHLLGVNIIGTLATMNAAAAHWRRTGPATGRAIVNTSSPAGLHPLSPIGLYSATKAAVLALTQSAALELASLGVRVNAIAPIARTRVMDDAPEDMRALVAAGAGFDRFAPDNIAPLVVYLAGPACRFTGRVFGAAGDGVVLFDEWDAAHHISNDGARWTVAGLAAALAALPPQQRRRAWGPTGVEEGVTPPDEVLAALAKTPGEAR